MGVRLRVFSIASVALCAAWCAAVAGAQESRPESRRESRAGTARATVKVVASRNLDPYEFLRFRLDASDMRTASAGVAQVDERAFARTGDACEIGVVPGVAYRVVLRDVYGDLPSPAAEIAPLAVGEARRVVVPLPERRDIRVFVPEELRSLGDGSRRGVKFYAADSRPSPFPRTPTSPPYSKAESVEVDSDGIAVLPRACPRKWIVWAGHPNDPPVVFGPNGAKLVEFVGWAAVEPGSAPQVEPQPLSVASTRRLELRARSGLGDDVKIQPLEFLDGEGTPVPVAIPFGRDQFIVPATNLRLRAEALGRVMTFDVPCDGPKEYDLQSVDVEGVGAVSLRAPRAFLHGGRLFPIDVPALADAPPRPEGFSPMTFVSVEKGDLPETLETQVPLWPGDWEFRLGVKTLGKAAVKAGEIVSVALPQ